MPIRNLLKKQGISTQLRYRLRQYEKNGKQEIEENFTKISYDKHISIELDEALIKAICYTLIQWALDGKNYGNGYGFPFDRTHLEFYQRLCKVHDILENWNTSPIKITTKAQKHIQKLLYDISPIKSDENGIKSAYMLEEKIIVFDKLRKAMRITSDCSKKGLNDNGQDVAINTIEQGVREFKKWLCNKKCYAANKDYHKMTRQIEKYWNKLFADPIRLKTPNGQIIIQPQRTNNIMEQFFRSFRRAQRRRSGNNSICKTLLTMIAQTPLVKNLENKEYMNILLGDKKALSECFAEIESKIFKEEFEKSKQYIDKIPLTIKKAIKKENIPFYFDKLFKKHFFI